MMVSFITTLEKMLQQLFSNLDGKLGSIEYPGALAITSVWSGMGISHEKLRNQLRWIF